MLPFALFYRFILRPLRAERVRTGVAILSVALGVAAVVAIELAGEAATGSFQSSMETLLGDASFEVTGGGGVPAEAVTRLAALPYALRIHPRIEAYATITATRRIVPLIGLDLVSESDAENGAHNDSPDVSPNVSLDGLTPSVEDSVWVSKSLGYKVGDRLPLTINDTSGEYTVRGVLGQASGDIVLMDLATATAVLRRTGNLDRILIDLPAGANRGDIGEWQKLLRAALPEGLSLAPEGSQTEENRRMLAAFRWNLRVLSYVSLAVGAFLIYNTISVSVVRRRSEIGILRALGVTRGGILAGFLGEAAALGLLGSLAGVVMGRLMATGAVKMVAATVTSLYVSSRPGAIEIGWSEVWVAVAVGVGISVLSAFSPAWEASRVAPVEAMARGRIEHKAEIAEHSQSADRGGVRGRRIHCLTAGADRRQADLRLSGGRAAAGSFRISDPVAGRGSILRSSGRGARCVRSRRRSSRRGVSRDRCDEHRSWWGRCPPRSQCWWRSGSWWEVFAKRCWCGWTIACRRIYMCDQRARGEPIGIPPCRQKFPRTWRSFPKSKRSIRFAPTRSATEVCR